MKLILLINSIFTLSIGITLILRPDMVFWFSFMDETSINISKMYGMALTIVGTLSFIIYKHGKEDRLIRLSALSVSALHLILCFHFYGLYASDFVIPWWIFATESVITLVLIAIYLKNL